MGLKVMSPPGGEKDYSLDSKKGCKLLKKSFPTEYPCLRYDVLCETLYEAFMLWADVP
jgi:hypothetical protein